MNVIERIDKDFELRKAKLVEHLEKQENFQLLNEALKMKPQSCFSLFGVANESLEDVEYLCSFLDNCVLDDSTLTVKVVKHCETICSLRLAWGGDDAVRVSTEDALEMVSLSNKADQFHKDNFDALENDCCRDTLRKYFNFDKKIQSILEKYLTPEQQREVDEFHKARQDKLNK